MKNDYESFRDRSGELVSKYGFTQVPNITIRNCHELGIKPLDLVILLYFLSYPEKDFHAASTIAKSLGVHINTVRTALYRMEGLRLISPEHTFGEANKYVISGWVNKIKEYAIINQSSTQNLDNESNQNYDSRGDQIIGNNKHNTKKKDGLTGYEKFKETRKRLRR